MMAIQPGIAPLDHSSNAATASPGYGANSRRRALNIFDLCVKGDWHSTRRIGRGSARSMIDEIKLPDDCADMLEVRHGVDTTDRELMALLDRRFGYMRAAARIKQARDTVRDEGRKAQVIANAREDAAARQLPAAELADLWERLVETSIAYELVEWDRLRRT